LNITNNWAQEPARETKLKKKGKLVTQSKEKKAKVGEENP